MAWVTTNMIVFFLVCGLWRGQFWTVTGGGRAQFSIFECHLKRNAKYVEQESESFQWNENRKVKPLTLPQLINNGAMTGASCASEINSEEAPVTWQWSACSPATTKYAKVVCQKHKLNHCKQLQAHKHKKKLDLFIQRQNGFHAHQHRSIEHP